MDHVKRSLWLIALVAVASLRCAALHAQVQAYPPGWWRADQGGNDHVYMVVYQPQACWGEVNDPSNPFHFPHLVTITSAAEDQFVRELLASANPPTGAYFINLHRTGAGGPFVWADGEPLSYTAWYPGEPNGSGALENVGSILWTQDQPGNGRSGLWNDVPECIFGRPGYVNDYAAGGAVYEGPCTPVEVQAPVSLAACPGVEAPGGPVTSAVSLLADMPVTYRWFRDRHGVVTAVPAVVLADDGVTVIATTTGGDQPRLHVTPTAAWPLDSNQDRWFCRLTNACGTVDGTACQVFVDGGDVGRQGGFFGRDGAHDNNDFIAFISLFFAADPQADFGRQGGVLGGDGAFDNNDFIAFINLFFAACP